MLFEELVYLLNISVERKENLLFNVTYIYSALSYTSETAL